MPLLQRLYHFFARPVADPAIDGLYRACIAQARKPEFYHIFGIPDTVDGRFDLLLLHVFLVMQRLDKPEARQQLFDLMFADMDLSLREMGVGDVSIGKKMKPMLAAFYGRSQAYQQALAGVVDLPATLQRNLYGKVEATSENLRQLTAYVCQSTERLEDQTAEEILNNGPAFAELHMHQKAA